jgi:hypothetical protein
MAAGASPQSTAPTGLSTATNAWRQTVLTTTTNDPGLAAGYKSDWASGAFDCPALTGYTTTNTGSWTAATLALRPQAVTIGNGSSSGSATVSAVGKASAKGAGSASGVATLSGIGKAQARTSGSSSGSSAVGGLGKTGLKGTGASSGSSSAAGVGKAKGTGIGGSSGAVVALGIGAARRLATGISSAAATVIGAGASKARGGGSTAGTAAVSGAGRAASRSVGSSVATAVASGQGRLASVGRGTALSGGTDGETAVFRIAWVTRDGRDDDDVITLFVSSHEYEALVLTGYAKPLPPHLKARYRPSRRRRRHDPILADRCRALVTDAGSKATMRRRSWRSPRTTWRWRATGPTRRRWRRPGRHHAHEVRLARARLHRSGRECARAASLESTRYGQEYQALLQRNRGGPLVAADRRGAPTPAALPQGEAVMGLLDGGLAAPSRGRSASFYLDGTLYRPNALPTTARAAAPAHGFAPVRSGQGPDRRGDAGDALGRGLRRDRPAHPRAGHGVDPIDTDCEIVAGGTRWGSSVATRILPGAITSCAAKRKADA